MSVTPTWVDPEPWVIVSPLDGSAYRSRQPAEVPVESCEYQPRTREEFLIDLKLDEKRAAWLRSQAVAAGYRTSSGSGS